MKTLISKGTKTNGIALLVFILSINGPPIINPKIEHKPNIKYPSPSISIDHPLELKIKIWWKIRPVPINGELKARGK